MLSAVFDGSDVVEVTFDTDISALDWSAAVLEVDVGAGFVAGTFLTVDFTNNVVFTGGGGWIGGVPGNPARLTLAPAEVPVPQQVTIS